MWQAIQSALTSDNFWKSVIGIGALVILFAILVKKGLISFKGHGLSVGTAESERTIVRQQIEFCKTQAETMANQLIDSYKDADKCRIKYICELVYDIWIEAISYNHITKDPFYIQNRFEKVWAVILKETSTESFSNDAFKKVVFEECKKVIERLVDIKDYYSK